MGTWDVPRFEFKVAFFRKIVNILTLCQIGEHLQDTLFAKLLGQFVELHNTQFFQKKQKTRKFDSKLKLNLHLYRKKERNRGFKSQETIYI